MTMLSCDMLILKLPAGVLEEKDSIGHVGAFNNVDEPADTCFHVALTFPAGQFAARYPGSGAKKLILGSVDLKLVQSFWFAGSKRSWPSGSSEKPLRSLAWDDLVRDVVKRRAVPE